MKDTSVTRRSFMQAAGGGALGALLPGEAHGSARTASKRLVVGASKWDIDTPALCLDYDTFKANLSKMQRAVTAKGLATRPHAKTHRTPQIARLQLEAGAVGVCVAKIGEAEVFFSHGIDRLLMTTSNVTPRKISRAMSLRQWCPTFIQATDTPENARDLSAAAKAAGVVADVVIDVDPGSHRTGISPRQPALELAQLVDKLPGLRLRGILCYDGGSQHVMGFDARRAQTLERVAPAAETLASMKRSGLNTEIFSGGGTGTYNIDHETPGFTDVQVGSYIFMDAQYLAIGGSDGAKVYSDFQSSLTILATVVNAQHSGMATTDAGAKACTINQPWPIVKGETGMTYTSGSDEFGIIRYQDPSKTYRVGDKLELIVSHCDPTVNLYDEMYVVRNDRVEAVWPIAARGKST